MWLELLAIAGGFVLLTWSADRFDLSCLPGAPTAL
jgi:hypothetical protein